MWQLFLLVPSLACSTTGLRSGLMLTSSLLSSVGLSLNEHRISVRNLLLANTGTKGGGLYLSSSLPLFIISFHRLLHFLSYPCSVYSLFLPLLSYPFVSLYLPPVLPCSFLRSSSFHFFGLSPLPLSLTPLPIRFLSLPPPQVPGLPSLTLSPRPQL